MRSRKVANEQVAEVARRRLELLSAELAGISGSLPIEGSTPSGSAAQAETTVVSAPPGKHAHRSIGLAGRIGGWVHDRLPPTLQGSVGLTSAHLTVVALLVAAAIAVAGWWALRAEGPGTLVPAAVRTPLADTAAPLVEVSGATAATPPTAAQTSAEASSSPGAEGGTVIIDVAGKVRRPGIATLPAGARVADALQSAGGARRGVNLMTINLARVLVDGEQIVVGLPAPSGVAAPAASAALPSAAGSPGELVNVNTADQLALETLPGVGPVTAQAILTWRTENGAFTSVDELLEVSGIGEATLAEMAPFVTI